MKTRHRNTHYYSLKWSTYASKPIPKLWRGCAPGLCGIQGHLPLQPRSWYSDCFLLSRNSRNWHTGWPCLQQQSKHFMPPLWKHCHLPAMFHLFQHVSSSTIRELLKDLYFSWLLTYRANVYWEYLEPRHYSQIQSLKTYFLSHVHIQICQIIKVELTVHLR